MTEGVYPERISDSGQIAGGPSSRHERHSSEEIRRGIERIRAEMSRTIEAIKRRTEKQLSPESIVREKLKLQAKVGVVRTARGPVRQMASKARLAASGLASAAVGTFKTHPVAAALAIIGGGALFALVRRLFQGPGTSAGGRWARGSR